MKKRIFALTLAICLLLSLGACGEKEETKKAEKKPTITWVTTGIGSLLPTPESGKVEITYDSSDSFEADVTDITKEDFSKYVEECKKNGFTVDYYGNSDSFDAEDKDGNSLSIEYYEDENKMNIDIYNFGDFEDYEDDEDDEEDEELEEETTKAKTTKAKTTVPATTKAKEKTTKPAKASSGVNADFKETMDSYEEFFNDYVDFMKKYENSDDVTSMMTDYADYMSKYSDMMGKLDSIDTDSLSADDYAYYVEVNARITKKLAEVAQ